MTNASNDSNIAADALFDSENKPNNKFATATLAELLSNPEVSKKVIVPVKVTRCEPAVDVDAIVKSDSLHEEQKMKKKRKFERLRERLDAPKEEPISRVPKGSKRPKIVTSTKKNEPVCRDPRFDDLSGQFNQEFFDDNYQFLREIKDKEFDEISRNYKKCKDPEQRDKMGRLMQRYREEKKNESKRKFEREIVSKHLDEELEKVEKGKKPFFLKKGEIMKRVKEAQVEAGLEKESTKKKENREMKTAQKSRRNFPSTRR